MIVCVLGMHRSGTSLVTRLLNVLGVHLGGERDLIDASHDNPTGFWEHRRIQKLNDEILGRLGGAWAQLPSLSQRWAQAPEMEDFRRRARTIVDEDFAGVPVWGWKDPRTSVTLPFWQEILPGMQYVICLRHPVASSLSLRRRDGLSLEEGIDLWVRHVRLALEHTEGSKRIVVFYEQVMEDWRPVMGDLARFLGCPERAGDPQVLQEVDSFIDQGLNHHRSSGEDAAALGLSTEAFSAAQGAYDQLADQGPHFQERAISVLDQTLDVVRPGVERARQESRVRWLSQIRLFRQEIDQVVPPSDTVILVDQDMLATGVRETRAVVPFLERNGQYWGTPPDDATAIRELERLRQSGASFIAFAWPAFWWLDHYSGFLQYLRSTFRCPVHNDRLVIFDLGAPTR